MTDMEGVCGVINFHDWVTPGGRYYEEGKKLLTMEVNAAVEGFFSAGATEIRIIDAHGSGGINQSVLDNRTYLVRGCSGPWPFTLDSSFDAIAWIGQHAKAGTEYAHLAHTQSMETIEYKINGISVGEFGQLAMCGSYLGVYSIFGSGDEAFTIEAQELVKGIETVSVKSGLMPGSGDECDTESYTKRNNAAIHMHPERARKLIRDGAEKALVRFINDKKSFQLLELKPPFKAEGVCRAEGYKPVYRTISEHPDDLIKMLNSPEKGV